MTRMTETATSDDAAPPAMSGAVDLLNANKYLAHKRTLDFILAVLLSILTFPLMLLAMALVKLSSRGPAIYRQTRVGRHGRHFTIYKIRSMARDSERLTGAQWATPHDPRVTPVGAILRVTHVDELPQLWNVLRGEMSLVGPRPERPEFVGPLEQAVPHYGDRLLVLPGVTGLAQVQLPPDSDLHSVRRKLACDLYYVQRVNLWLDLRIILGTAIGVLGIPFLLTGKLLRIPGGSTAEEAYRDLSAKAKVIAVVRIQSA